MSTRIRRPACQNRAPLSRPHSRSRLPHTFSSNASIRALLLFQVPTVIPSRISFISSFGDCCPFVSSLGIRKVLLAERFNLVPDRLFVVHSRAALSRL